VLLASRLNACLRAQQQAEAARSSHNEDDDAKVKAAMSDVSKRGAKGAATSMDQVATLAMSGLEIKRRISSYRSRASETAQSVRDLHTTAMVQAQ